MYKVFINKSPKHQTVLINTQWKRFHSLLQWEAVVKSFSCKYSSCFFYFSFILCIVCLFWIDLFIIIYYRSVVRQSLGTVASNGLTVQAIDNRWVWGICGMVIDRRRLRFSEKNLLHCHFMQYRSHMNNPGLNSCLHGEMLVTKHLSWSIT